jgi:hypothetical protein
MYTMDRAKWTLYAIMRSKYPEKAKSMKAAYLRTAYIPTDNNGWKTAFYGDESITYKRFFPFYFTEEEKEEFTEDHWRRIYSPYDCTGQWFTRSIDFFKTNNGTWVYHFMGLDI